METQVEQLDGDRVRLTVEVPAARRPARGRARDARPRGARQGPGLPAGQGAAAGAALADREGAAVLRGGRVAHQQLVLERRAHARASARPSSPTSSYELPTTDAESWQFTAEFAVQTAARAGRLDDARGAEARGRGRRRGRRRSSSKALQRMVAELSPVEGRPAREGDVAVVDIVSDDGPGPARLRRRARRRAARRRDRGRRSAISLPGESQQVALGARRRLAPRARRSP